MSAQCAGIKRNGSRCTGVVAPSKQYCWWHDPHNADERKRASSKGGKGRLSRRIAPLWDEVRAVIAGVEARRLTPTQANSMLRGYGVLVELAKLEIEQGGLEVQQKRLELDVEERAEILPQLEEMGRRLSEG